MNTTLLVATLNEIEGMRAVMPRVKPEWCDQILVVDGGSTDGTIEYARERGYEVVVQKKPGLWQGYREAWPHIRGDAVITFSPDGNSIPELIPDLITKMREGHDMVIASRYLGPAKSADDDIITGFGNWLFTKTVNLLHGGGYTDVMVIYRIFRTKLFYELGIEREDYAWLERMLHTRLGAEPLISVRMAKTGKRIAEIPGDEPPRLGGVRKLQIIRWGLAYYAQFWLERFSWPVRDGRI